MFDETHITSFIWTLIYVVFGMGLFAVSFFAISKAVPFSIRKEIEEDQNTALAIIIGSVMIGLALIVAAGIG